MEPGPNKAHEHPYGSTVIPPTATPPVAIAEGRSRMPGVVHPRQEPAPIIPAEVFQIAIDAMIEQITTCVVERVTAQLAPVIDRMMWAIEEARLPKVDYNKIVDDARQAIEDEYDARQAIKDEYDQPIDPNKHI